MSSETTGDENAVRKEIVVEAAAERAFRVFTERMELWWPPEHHIGQAAMARPVLEPRAGGRWYELGEDGSTCDWGRVLAWEPPRRLVLAWQISAAWKFDPALVTEVEVTFVAEGQSRTRVTLEHRNLDRFGPASEAMRKSFSSEGGWGLTLGRFATAAGAAS
jgi:uncharacterized protein YndB with AHSA1/START domain